jgi:hypothetical protein
MANTIRRQHTHWLSLAGVLVAMLLAGFGSSPSKAEASTSAYCNNVWLGAYGDCWGERRNLYAVSGWGDHHSVCVGFAVNPAPGMINPMCSGGAGAGVYNPWGTTFPFYPAIRNNAAGNNLVHGVAYQ